LKKGRDEKMSQLKKQLYRELEIKNAAYVEGIRVDTAIFSGVEIGTRYQEQVHNMFEMDHDTHVGIEFPVGFTTPSGFTIPFRWDNRSAYALSLENGIFYLTHREKELFPVAFLPRPQYYSLKTSDGMPMHNVATYRVEGTIFVAYSNECFLKDKGQDCLFCNINATDRKSTRLNSSHT
jgi:hypothetical protein